MFQSSGNSRYERGPRSGSKHECRLGCHWNLEPGERGRRSQPVRAGRAQQVFPGMRPRRSLGKGPWRSRRRRSHGRSCQPAPEPAPRKFSRIRNNFSFHFDVSIAHLRALYHNGSPGLLPGQHRGACFSVPGRDSSRPLFCGPASASTSAGAARKSASQECVRHTFACHRIVRA